MNKKLNNNFSLRKLLLTALVAGPLATLPAPLWALPVSDLTNLTTSAGVTIQVIGANTLNLTTPDKAVLTWQAFGSGASTIGAADTINYFLPTAAGSVLNSVTGGGVSRIDGKLLSNGNIYLLNPSGIVIGSGANINAAGFYASTIAEPSGFFTINGSLSFQGTSTTNVVVEAVQTAPGVPAVVGPPAVAAVLAAIASPTIQALGTTVQSVGTANVIYLAGKEIDIQGGNFFGNVFIKSTGAENSLGAVAAVVGPPAVAAVIGDSVRFASIGPVNINQVSSPLVGGALNITSAGGNVKLSGPTSATQNNNLSVAGTAAGALTVNTTGSGVNGGITQGAGRVQANATGSTVSLIAGGNAQTSADITLGDVNFVQAALTGKTITVNDSDGLTLGNIVATGNLSLKINGSNSMAFATGATAAVTGDVTLLSGSTGRSLTFAGTGDLRFISVPDTAAISVTSTGNVTFAQATLINAGDNNFSATSTGGNIASGALGISTNRTLTLSAAAGKITTPVLTSKTATLTAGGDITIATSLGQLGVVTNLGTNQTVTSTGGNITIGAVNTVTTITLAAPAGSITLTGAFTNTAANTTSSTMTANAGSITLAGLSTTNNATVTLSGGSVTNVGTISTSTLSITATTGSLNLGAVSVTRPSSLVATAAGGSITATSLTNTSANGFLTLNSNASVVIPTSATGALSVTSATGSITQSGAITRSATPDAGNEVRLNAFTDIILDNGGNDFHRVGVTGGTSANSFVIVDANGLIVGNPSTGAIANAPTTFTAKTLGIQLGNGSGDVLTFGSTLKLVTETAPVAAVVGPPAVAAVPTAITTVANTINVFGAVTLNTVGADATLGNPNVSSALVNYKFGQINAALGAGNLTVVENTTLNLGAITANNITSASSIGGDVVNSGALVLAGTAKVAAGSIFGPTNVSLNNASNAISVAVSVSNAADFTLVNTKNTTVTIGTTDNGRAASGTTSVTVTGATLGVANTLTIANAVGGDLNTVSFSAPGAVTVTETGTTNGIVLQNLTTTGAGAVTVTASGPVVLGSGIALGGTGVVSITASGDITDTTPGVRIFGNTVLNSTGGNIGITKTGHSLGQVSLTTGLLAGNITYTEGGSANIKSVTFPAAGTGNLSVTSTGGSILQGTPTVNDGGIRVPATAGTVTLSAPNGAVTLTNPNPTAATNNSILRPIAITASGDSSVSQSESVILGNVAITAGGLTVNTSAGNAKTITQAADTAAKVFGGSTFRTSNGAITLTNTATGGNNFGGITAETNLSVNATATLALVGGVPTFLAGSGGTGYTPSVTNIPVTVVTPGTTTGVVAAFTANTDANGVITGFTNVGAAGTLYTVAPTVTIAAPTAILAGANVAITEGGTLNFTQVRTGTAGTLTAVSTAGAIVQNGAGGLNVGGVSSFTASAAGIALATTTTNNFGGKAVSLTTTGAASLQDVNAVTVLGGGSNIGGNLSIKNTLGTGEIKDSPGNLTVTGTVLFDTTTAAASKVNIGSSTANFGAITFRSGAVTIVENADLNLAAGSVATGAVSLTSSGNITSSGNGGATFQNKLDLNASGGITITNPIFVNGVGGVAPGLTFRALGVVNLGALSLAGNLNGIAPVNLGASSYTPPAN